MFYLKLQSVETNEFYPSVPGWVIGMIFSIEGVFVLSVGAAVAGAGMAGAIGAASFISGRAEAPEGPLIGVCMVSFENIDSVLCNCWDRLGQLV